jgi:hypothetical protein
MDLVQMLEFNSYNYILRVIDHLSKFGYVQPLKKWNAKEVGDALLGILCSSIMPRILQSDNGAEVSFFLFCNALFLILIPSFTYSTNYSS